MVVCIHVLSFHIGALDIFLFFCFPPENSPLFNLNYIVSEDGTYISTYLEWRKLLSHPRPRLLLTTYDSNRDRDQIEAQ